MTEQMTAFEKANLQHEQLKIKSENPVFTKDYPEIHYLGLKNKTKTNDYFSVFRILSNPINVDRKPTDCKLVYRSDISTDKNDGSFFECNWPQEVDSQGRENGNLDKTWILYQAHEEITKGKWFKDAAGKDVKDYFYKDTDALNMVLRNEVRGNKKHFKGTRQVMINVLDKMDLDFHRRIKKSKFLASSHKKWDKSPDPKNPIYFTNKGVPYVVAKNASGFYDILWDRVAGTRGNWDIDIISYLDGMRYEIFDATDILSNPKYKDHPVRQFISDQPLEDEFKNLELYNFDRLFHPTSYNKLRRNKSNFFKAVDLVCNTKFYDKLLDLSAEEKKRFQEIKKENQSNVVIQKTTDISEPQEEKSDALNVRRKIEQSVQPNIQNDQTQNIEEECRKKFPKWDKISPQDRKVILDNIVKFDTNGLIVWNPAYPSANIYPCSEADCKLPGTNIASAYPIEVLMCPVCEAKFAANS